MLKKHTRRITVDLKGESVQDLAELARSLGLTAVAVIRRAVRLLKLIQTTHEEGGKVQIVSKNGETTNVEVL